jgi:rare lipoprotein A
MSWVRIVASVSVGLLLSACAESAMVQKSNLTNVGAAPVGVTAAKSAASGSASFGLASYYSYPGRTANGERYDPKQLTAAHRTLPFGTKLQVTNVKSGRSVVVRVNDRGPFIRGRVVDVSYAAARELDLLHAGTAKVRLEVLNQ